MLLGFAFAGLEYQSQCFCGKELPANQLKIANNNCNMTCFGSESETCGGYFAIEIYKTGLTSKIQLIQFYILPLQFLLSNIPLLLS